MVLGHVFQVLKKLSKGVRKFLLDEGSCKLQSWWSEMASNPRNHCSNPNFTVFGIRLSSRR